MDRVKEQKRIVFLLTAGVVLCLGGTILFIVLTVLAGTGGVPDSVVVPISVGAFILGALCFPAAIILGWKSVGVRDSSRPVMREPNSYIISCRVETKQRQQVFDVDMYEEHELERLVQVLFRNGEKFEFLTDAATYDTIGEGMVGVLTFQGRRILKFEPDLRATESKKFTPGALG